MSAWSGSRSARVCAIRAVVRFPDGVRMTVRESQRHQGTSLVSTSQLTSTNLAKAGLLPFSFSNSYLPYSWCAPYLTYGPKCGTRSRKMSPIWSTTCACFCRLLRSSHSRTLTAYTSRTFQKTWVTKSSLRASGMMFCVRSGLIQNCKKRASGMSVPDRPGGRSDWETKTYIPQVLEISDKISLGVEHLVDRFLSLLLQIRRRIDHLLRDRMDPE